MSATATPKKRSKPKPSTLKNKCDAIFSQLVRARGRCERCGRPDGLETSHIYSRRYSNTRCDFANALCLCHADHRFWHDRPLDAVSWLHEIRPLPELLALRDRAQPGIKVDWSEKYAELKTLLDIAAL